MLQLTVMLTLTEFVFPKQSQRSSSPYRPLHQRFQLVRYRKAHQETPRFQRRPHIHVSFRAFNASTLKRSFLQTFSLNLTDRYYHSRAVKNTAPSQASTSATSATSTNAQLPTDETEAEIPAPSAQHQSQGPTDLPSFMKGVCVFFYNLPASERKRLSRYLITYPFKQDAFFFVTAGC